ncbi:MAG TPA: integrase arm-type DNA-binding domain-containing protein, partial [Burkholderiales bacterium]|nr:integrase arm-type DNA-binding domain-containing protein [Burkholderiales bacterium]
MPKKARELTATAVRNKGEGLHAVGGVAGLLINVKPSGARSWILRVMVGDRRRDIGLGGFPDVPLAEARQRARDAREMIRQGIDPAVQRQAAQDALRAAEGKRVTFRKAAERFLQRKRPEFRSEKHAAQWKNTLETYAYPVIGSLPVDRIELPHIKHILDPIWTKKTETAKRLRGRIESVLAYATASGFRTGDNPARWRGNLDAVMPKPGKLAKVEHHRALPVDGLPEFMAALRQVGGMGARALEFAILTGTRSGEVRGATWAEIDTKAKTWTIPGERMKAGRAHRVPLSPAAVALLKALPRLEGSEFVFPAARGGMLSDMTLSAVTRRMGVDAVPHGFRSTFRDWCAEHTNYPREVAEQALAHTISNAVEAAYRRGDLFEK